MTRNRCLMMPIANRALPPYAIPTRRWPLAVIDASVPDHRPWHGEVLKSASALAGALLWAAAVPSSRRAEVLVLGPSSKSKAPSREYIDRSRAVSIHLRYYGLRSRWHLLAAGRIPRTVMRAHLWRTAVLKRRSGHPSSQASADVLEGGVREAVFFLPHRGNSRSPF